jgi:hypothetical protein
LDSKERVIDMVMTGRGKELLLQGRLKFAYWAAFDDEVDYDPYVAGSGSMSEGELNQARQRLTEDPLVRECCASYKLGNMTLDDNVSINRPLYTLSPGGGVQDVSPLVSMSLGGGSSKVDVEQFVVGKQIRLSPLSVYKGAVSYTPEAYEPKTQFEGCVVSVFASSSDGYQRLHTSVDSRGDVVFGNILKFEGTR